MAKVVQAKVVKVTKVVKTEEKKSVPIAKKAITKTLGKSTPTLAQKSSKNAPAGKQQKAAPIKKVEPEPNIQAVSPFSSNPADLVAQFSKIMQ